MKTQIEINTTDIQKIQEIALETVVDEIFNTYLKQKLVALVASKMAIHLSKDPYSHSDLLQVTLRINN